MSCNDYQLNEKGPLGKDVKDIIISTENVIVYMDADDTIQWYTENYDDFHEFFGEIQNKVSDWENKTNKLFKKEDAYSMKCILAEAYARILDNKNIELARDIINKAMISIEKKGREILKQYYAVASFFGVVVICCMIVISKFNKGFIESKYGTDEYSVFMTTLFGGIGAFIFTIIRLKSYKPDIEISKNIHVLDGLLRIFYGIIFGLIIAIAIKSNLLLGFLNQVEKNIYLSIFMGICAGASEIIIPNLIKQVETKVQE